MRRWPHRDGDSGQIQCSFARRWSHGYGRDRLFVLAGVAPMVVVVVLLPLSIALATVPVSQRPTSSLRGRTSNFGMGASLYGLGVLAIVLLQAIATLPSWDSSSFVIADTSPSGRHASPRRWAALGWLSAWAS